MNELVGRAHKQSVRKTQLRSRVEQRSWKCVRNAPEQYSQSVPVQRDLRFEQRRCREGQIEHGFRALGIECRPAAGCQTILGELHDLALVHRVSPRYRELPLSSSQIEVRTR